MTEWKKHLPLAVLAVVMAGAAVAWGQSAGDNPPASPEVQTKGLLDFIRAGGWVSYTLIALSVIGAALVIEAFLHLKIEKIMPRGMVEQAEEHARKGRFSQILPLSQASDNLIGRILRGGMQQGSFGLPAVRQAMQEQGVKEMTRLSHRVNYMGFIGAIAPMMGLLGTVLGMVNSFHVLGSKGASARPDELAVGISFALVTTCEGLILAIPMMFFHNYFRDRVTRLGQECSGFCERLLRLMGAVLEARAARAAGPAPAGAAATAGEAQRLDEPRPVVLPPMAGAPKAGGEG
jgi:biopolymer transport protein ExbB